MADIIVLEINFQFGEIEDSIYPVVLQDDKNMVLIDCGYSGFLMHIENAMRKAELDCSKLTHIVVTHHDHDHMGALFAMKQKYPQIQVVTSEKEEPYISGKKKSLRLEQAEARQSGLSGEEKAFGERFCDLLKSIEPAEVSLTVRGGDKLDWCGGCEIVDTPGHTPGHISIYVKNKKTMITGDAAALENGNLIIPNPQYTLDMEAAKESMNKIFVYNPEEIICYHGGILKTPVDTKPQVES